MWSAWSVVMPGWMPGHSGDHYVPPAHTPPFYAPQQLARSRKRRHVLLSFASGIGKPPGAFGRLGDHQAQAAAAPFDFSDIVFDFSDATDEAPHEDGVVRAPAAHRQVAAMCERSENLE